MPRTGKQPDPGYAHALEKVGNLRGRRLPRWVKGAVLSINRSLSLFANKQTILGPGRTSLSGHVCGRLRFGKKNLHFAALVGTAMCSAFLRG